MNPLKRMMRHIFLLGKEGSRKKRVVAIGHLNIC